MPEYHVEWRIEVEADSPEDAARLARKIQREQIDPVYHVNDGNDETVVDFAEAEDQEDITS